MMCNCQANISGSHGNKGISEPQFGAFLAEALKGTYEEKADLMSLFSDGDKTGATVGNLYKVCCKRIKIIFCEDILYS